MAASKMIPILNDKEEKIGERFEASDDFKKSLDKNYVEMKDADGRVIRVNKKLRQTWPAGEGVTAQREIEKEKKMDVAQLGTTDK